MYFLFPYLHIWVFNPPIFKSNTLISQLWKSTKFYSYKIDFIRIDFDEKWVECKLIYVWMRLYKIDSYQCMLFG